jgi:hypothetical protein
VVCVVIDKQGALVLRYATQPDEDTLPENVNDPYADCAEQIVKTISDIWNGIDADGEAYSHKFIDSRGFLFLPEDDMVAGAKHKDAVKGLEESIPKVVGEPVQVTRYQPASDSQGAFISVFHEGEHLPKVLLQGKQVLPKVPNAWSED